MSDNDGLTDNERGWLSIMRLNAVTPHIEIRKTWAIGRLAITFNWRSRRNLWGRFGGGWNWKLGVEIGSTTVMVYLLICSLRFAPKVAP